MTIQDTLTAEMEEAKEKAWDSLSRYKFAMFGYWSGIWVHLNRISGKKEPNPFKSLVHHAQERNQNKIGSESKTKNK